MFEVKYRCECCDKESDTIREATVFDGQWYVCQDCYTTYVVDPFNEDPDEETC